MKSKKNKRFIKNQSASRHTNKKVRKKDIKIKSENQNIRKRSKKRLKAQKRKFMIRRIVLLLILVFIIFLLARTIFRKINKYDSYSYPKFRDNVMDSITKEIFVGNTDDRSLKSAE